MTQSGLRTFDAQATRDALPFRTLIDALRRMFVQGCEVPLRHTHTFEAAPSVSATMLLMPAWSVDGLLGVKTVMVHPGNTAGGLPGLHSTYLLYDRRTGVPLALMDGNEITSRRTAAASALAASIVSKPRARSHLVIGAGRVGRLIPEAYREVIDIESFAIWDRTADTAREVVQQLRSSGISARVSTDLAADAAAADIVTCATLAASPVVRGEWLCAHSHLDLIGSFTPTMREADDACFANAAIYVDTEEALQKSGDLLGPMACGVFNAADVRGTLADLCRDPDHARARADGRTVFKSVGTALEDLAAASVVYGLTPS